MTNNYISVILHTLLRLFDRLQISFPEDVATASVSTSDSILDVVNAVKGYVKDSVSDAMYKVENGVQYHEKKIKNKLSEVEDIVRERVNQAQDKMSNKISIVQENLKDIYQKVTDFKEKYNEEFVKETVSKYFFPRFQYFNEALQKVSSGLSEIDDKFYTALFNVVQKVSTK